MSTKPAAGVALLSLLAPLWLAPAAVAGEASLDYYLPRAADYDPAIPKPAEVLGWEVGEWHVRHDQLVRYLEVLAAASPRLALEVKGRTHEARPLLLVTITSPANHGRLEEIRRQHLALSEVDGDDLDTASMPVVVNMGYSVHGNEPSGANASLLLAYHLAAAGDQQTLDLLDRSVILLDPCLNPDGLARFAHWANSHKGRQPVADPQSREHQEPWPSGRTNHYWFDLNRDWLLAQHPENQARLAKFHSWRPNVLTDFHEMGTNATYFFQPGVPTRKNPWTPARNVELTQAIAEYHARALDAVGSLYYTEETFDDFYYGKGSTYPDVHGAVGILFEQASSRGHLQDSIHGPVSFPFTIRNQLITSLSTLRAALDLRVQLLDYQRDFYRQSLDMAAKDSARAFVFGDAGDPVRGHRLAELLARHAIEVRRPAREIRVDGERFAPDDSYLVPLDQRQYRLIRSMFEQRLEFDDNTFYDVSTWTLPLAFGLPFAELGKDDLRDAVGAVVDPAAAPAGRFRADPEAVAYAFEWHGYLAPRGLYRMLRQEVRAYAAKKPFRAVTAAGERDFDRGTVTVPLGAQTVERQRVEELLRRAADEDGLEVFALTSGLTPSGIDLGSPNLVPLAEPKVAVLVGRGLSTYEAGQIWHLLDHRYGLETTLLELSAVATADLDRYSHLVRVDSERRRGGGSVQSQAQDRGDLAIRRWVRRGGVLIALQRSATWAGQRILAEQPEVAAAEPTHGSEPPAVERRPYGEFENDRAVQLIGGAIFEVDLDLTHPLAFGYTRRLLPVFKNNQVTLETPADPYATVAAFTATRLAGYASAENRARLADSPAVAAERRGDGLVVRMGFDPSFRAFWYGTQRLVLNSVFLSGLIEPTRRQEPRH